MVGGFWEKLQLEAVQGRRDAETNGSSARLCVMNDGFSVWRGWRKTRCGRGQPGWKREMSERKNGQTTDSGAGRVVVLQIGLISGAVVDGTVPGPPALAPGVPPPHLAHTRRPATTSRRISLILAGDHVPAWHRTRPGRPDLASRNTNHSRVSAIRQNPQHPIALSSAVIPNHGNPTRPTALFAAHHLGRLGTH